MIKLDIQNFGIIRAAQLFDDTPLSLIIGYNESGKSTLVGALQYVLTGSAFGLRGEGINDLITHGETRMHARLQLGPLNISRTPSTGDAIKGIADRLQVPADVLPLMFDSKLCGDGGNKAMRAFLDGVASSKFDAMAHFATDPIISLCITASRNTGKITTKQIIKFCEDMRALQKTPAIPVMPSVPNPAAAEIDAAQHAVSAAEANLVVLTNQLAELNKTGSDLLKITTYQKAVANYERLRSMATVNDSLGHTRVKLEKLSNVNANSLQAVKTLLADIPDLHNSVREARDYFSAGLTAVTNVVTWAVEYLKANPPPASAPVMPTLAPEASGLYAELKANDLLTDEALSAMAIATSQDATAASTESQRAQAQITTLRNILTSQLRNQGAWIAYAQAVPDFETAKAKAESDWKMWDDASKAIAAAEIDHINKAGDVFGTMVSDFSAYVLQGRKITINRDTGITLGGTSIDRCSVSCRWRIEVSVMAAIARMLKSPLLVIDAADVLDERNRATMQQFLLERIVPHFQHVVITSTCRGKIEDEQPSPDKRATKWIMSNGELRRLAAAAAV